MNAKDPIVIVGSVRTPMGGFQGDLKDAPAAALGATAIKAAPERSRLTQDQVDEVVFGCVLPVGQGQAPARQAALGRDCPVGQGRQPHPAQGRCAQSPGINVWGR